MTRYSYDNDDDDLYEKPRQRRRRPHSELGMASCVIATLAAATIFAAFVVGGIISARNPNLSDDDPSKTAVGCSLLIGGGLAVVGAVCNQIIPLSV